MSKELNIPLVCTNDIHYTKAEDAIAHDLLLCIQTGKKVDDEDRMRYEGGQFYVKSEEQMRALFPYALEAIENTQKIADMCDVTIEFGNYHLPPFDVPAGYTSRSYIEMLCEEGLKRKFPEECSDESKADELKKLKDRIEYELNIIDNLGFVNYFLIVSDFIKYAKNNGITVGPGRGSAAGSESRSRAAAADPACRCGSAAKVPPPARQPPAQSQTDSRPWCQSPPLPRPARW